MYKIYLYLLHPISGGNLSQLNIIFFKFQFIAECKILMYTVLFFTFLIILIHILTFLKTNATRKRISNTTTTNKKTCLFSQTSEVELYTSIILYQLSLIHNPVLIIHELSLESSNGHTPKYAFMTS
jgi:hypothetical protein